MPLTINGKVFLNLQEAVAWLLANNALPFQSTANFVADTEIAKTSIINPSPAEIRIGSLVLFADGKVGTVSGITANGFMVGADSTDLSDGVPHITNIELNASNHLIFTMSEGSPIDAGLVKMVSSFTINASQHLIVNYNDGTTQDLGAIFQGNITITGDLAVTGKADIDVLTSSENEISAEKPVVELMTGYTFTKGADTSYNTFEHIYAGVVKNGNKLTFAISVNVTKLNNGSNQIVGRFTVPAEVHNALYPVSIGGYDYLVMSDLIGVQQDDFSRKTVGYYIAKGLSNQVSFVIDNASLTANKATYLRFEATFLLSPNLVS